MAEATGVNRVGFQPEELKFDLTRMGGEHLSSSAQLTNPTDRPVGFAVEATDPDNYELKPIRGIVPPFGSRRINVTARGLPLVEQREGKISVLTFYVPPDYREEDLQEKCHHLCHRAISCHPISHSAIRVRWVNPEIQIPILMNKAAEEVSQQNLGLALETLREAIELRPDGFSHLCRALVNHLLGQKEGVERDFQEAERLFSISELAEGTGEHLASSEAYCIFSDTVGVPTYTTEKLCGRQMIVKWKVAVTENQLLDVEVRFTPSIKSRLDRDVEVSVIVDSLRAKVVRSETTDSFPDLFLQSLKSEVRPTGEWSESFSEGFGLIKCSPGNEVNSLSVQEGSSHGFAVGMNLGASPTAVLQWNGNNTRGTTSPPFGLKKSTRDGDAYVFEYLLHKFEDGSSTQNLGNTRFYTNPKIPKDVQDEVSYSKLPANYEGTWMVPYATAMKLRNQFKLSISLEAKLPAVWRCRKSSLKHLIKPPKHELEVRKMKTRRTCAFATAELKNFIRNNN